MLVIDTHAHIYSPDEERYPPMPGPLRPPEGSGSLDRLRLECKNNGVKSVCAIQTGSFYRFDNRYILDTSKANQDWLAAVCTLDPDNPDSPGLLERAVRDYGVRGMRSIASPKGGFDHAGIRALWKTALDEGIVINILITNRDPDMDKGSEFNEVFEPYVLGEIRELVDQAKRLLDEFSSLPVVLDHCLNLEAGPDLESWLAEVIRLSEHRNLHGKVSFVASGTKTGYPCDDMLEVCLKVIDAFGPERCVWGSDFPCPLWAPKINYTDHLRIFTDDLPLKESARAQVLGGTAQKLWFSQKAGHTQA